MSALGYSHKFLGYSDPTKAFFIQMLKGCNKLGHQLDARLPITLPVLQKLIESSATLFISKFQCCQFRAMCTTAFFAFPRIGEMTYNSAKDASNLILQVQYVQYVFTGLITFVLEPNIFVIYSTTLLIKPALGLHPEPFHSTS